jgi:hypothetical protein
LQPDVEQLAKPHSAGLVSALSRQPWPVFLLAGILPNAILCALNIAYNAEEILRHVENPDVFRVFKVQVIAVNAIAYIIGLSAVVALAWPVVRDIRKRLANPSAAQLNTSPHCERSFNLGKHVAMLIGMEWMVSGLVFPLWLQIALDRQHGLSAMQYVHFFGSQLICGLLAATICFFLLTWYSLRVFSPLLIDPAHDDLPLWHALRQLESTTSQFTRLTFATVPLALLLMPLVHTESRWTFFVLGLLGMLAWRLATVLERKIQRSIHALQVAVNERFAGYGPQR